MKAILITGNPKYINSQLAKLYYAAIVDYVKSLGVSCSTNPGADYTCPPPADFYIAHSRGCGRFRCVEKDPVLSQRFLRFGDPGGVNHPVDDAWLETMVGNPPPEHFIFTDEQRLAIRDLVTSIRATSTEPDFAYPSLKVNDHRVLPILAEGHAAPELGDIVAKRAVDSVVAFIANGVVVGFAIPRKDGQFYRTGPIYVTPKYRRKGVAAAFVLAYFKGRRGKAWIATTNEASKALYTRAGFKPSTRSMTDESGDYVEWLKGI